MPDNTVLEVSETGTILSVINGPHPEAVFYEGVLAPGFVNAHCHLELSHMKGVVPEHTGLIPFLKTIPKHRNDFTELQKSKARHNAYEELLLNGVVAVGDISNSTDTLDIRLQDKLHFHTFIEAIGFNDDRADIAFGYALQNYNAFAEQQSGKFQLRQAIAPHAPYSVSRSLFSKINAHSPGSTITIHNQESKAEDEFFRSGTGGVTELLGSLNIDYSAFIPSGKSSLQTYLDTITTDHSMIFVHNTYTQREDVQYTKSKLDKTFWCLCPNANLYIEGQLPDINMLLEEGAHICIGTDSLASNHQLCILSELYTIKQHYPDIDWELLLCWGTLGSACALQMQIQTGHISEGLAPGINQILLLDETGVKPVVKRIF